MFIAPTSSFVRPADTTQYSAGDLIANSTTAGSVVPLSFNVERLHGSGIIRRVLIHKTNATVTAAIFNLHLYHRAPTVTNGDNGAFAVDTTAYWIGTVACDMTSSSEVVTSVSSAQGYVISTGYGFDCPVSGLASSTFQAPLALYALISAGTSGTYTPVSAEVFKVTLEIEG